MRTTLWIAAVVLTAMASLPASALPRDCSYDYCSQYPDRVCAVPGTNRVIYCSEFLTFDHFAPATAVPEPRAASLDDLLYQVNAQTAPPAAEVSAAAPAAAAPAQPVPFCPES